MKKKQTPKPPEGWPPEARELYQGYFKQLLQRSLYARARMLYLGRFLSFQKKQGFGFRDFPTSLLDAYLELHRPRTSWSILSSLRSWMRFLYRRKELLLPLHDELSGIHRLPHQRRALLSYSQVLQVLHLPPLDTPGGIRDRAFLEVAYGTAMRRGEIAALELSDLDMAAGVVFLRATKNGRQRLVPLTRWAKHFLQRYLQESRPLLSTPLSPNALWLNRFGRKLHCDSVGQRLTKIYGAPTALEFPFTLHQLRHAAATHLLTAGASLRNVQELLGHSEPNSTATYTHITPIYLQEIHERCHPRNNGAIWPGKPLFQGNPPE